MSFKRFGGLPTWVVYPKNQLASQEKIIGIDHDMVCAGVAGTAIRHSTSCAGRRVAAPAGTTNFQSLHKELQSCRTYTDFSGNLAQINRDNLSVLPNFCQTRTDG